MTVHSDCLAPVAFFGALAAAAVVTSCSGSSFASGPANIGGNYSVSITSGDNGCEFPNWTSGAMTQNIEVAITQNGTTASATVSGLVAILFDVALGTAQFQGSVQGDTFTLTDIGSNAAKDGDCSYTLKATLSGTAVGS